LHQGCDSHAASIILFRNIRAPATARERESQSSSPADKATASTAVERSRLKTSSNDRRRSKKLWLETSVVTRQGYIRRNSRPASGSARYLLSLMYPTVLLPTLNGRYCDWSPNPVLHLAILSMKPARGAELEAAILNVRDLCSCRALQVTARLAPSNMASADNHGAHLVVVLLYTSRLSVIIGARLMKEKNPKRFVRSQVGGPTPTRPRKRACIQRPRSST
jgi:hypothetical protein